MRESARVRKAVAAGWLFPHSEAGSFRAEKRLANDQQINEYGESLDLLLTRIEAFEAHVASRQPSSAPPVVEGVEPVAEGQLSPPDEGQSY
jgi:hypothetical protein